MVKHSFDCLFSFAKPPKIRTVEGLSAVVVVIQCEHRLCSQSRRATNCATPRFYYIFYPVDFFCFLRNVRCASLKNIVVLLAWSASHYSLFFHLRASPVSSPGRGEPLRPTALRPDFIIFFIRLISFAFCVTSAALLFGLMLSQRKSL